MGSSAQDWLDEEEAESPGWIAEMDYRNAKEMARYSSKPVRDLLAFIRRLRRRDDEYAPA